MPRCPRGADQHGCGARGSAAQGLHPRRERSGPADASPLLRHCRPRQAWGPGATDRPARGLEDGPRRHACRARGRRFRASDDSRPWTAGQALSAAVRAGGARCSRAPAARARRLAAGVAVCGIRRGAAPPGARDSPRTPWLRGGLQHPDVGRVPGALLLLHRGLSGTLAPGPTCALAQVAPYRPCRPGVGDGCRAGPRRRHDLGGVALRRRGRQHALRTRAERVLLRRPGARRRVASHELSQDTSAWAQGAWPLFTRPLPGVRASAQGAPHRLGPGGRLPAVAVAADRGACAGTGPAQLPVPHLGAGRRHADADAGAVCVRGHSPPRARLRGPRQAQRPLPPRPARVHRPQRARERRR